MISALLGGATIGLAVSLMLLSTGRIAGISGILNGALSRVPGDRSWRWVFLAGMLCGGFMLRLLRPEAIGAPTVGHGMLALAGVLVGFGTVMGSGCTSGHGVCGISRLSPRSIVATLAFMAAGMLTVALVRHGGLS